MIELEVGEILKCISCQKSKYIKLSSHLIAHTFIVGLLLHFSENEFGLDFKMQIICLWNNNFISKYIVKLYTLRINFILQNIKMILIVYSLLSGLYII